MLSRVFLLAILLGPRLVLAAPSLAEQQMLDLINQSQTECTRGVATDCNAMESSFSVSGQPPADMLEIERKSIADVRGQQQPISVIREEDLAKLKALYSGDLRAFDEKVCVQRAHLVGEALAKAGVETVKLYLQPPWNFGSGRIEPDDRARCNSPCTYPIRWKWHVVNMIYVRTPTGETKEYIIDPFLEGMPVPREKWESRVKMNTVEKTTVMSRFNLGPGDFDKQVTDYDPSVMKTVRDIMAGRIRPDGY